MAKKKKLLIALDLDGVIFNFLDQFLKVHNLRKSSKVTVDDILAFMPAGSMEDVISESDWNESFEWFEDNGGYATLSRLDNVKNAIKNIIADGHELVYVTSRHSKFRGETIMSFLLNDIPVREVYFTPRGKYRKLNKLKPDVFVDDSLKNCQDAERAGIESIYLMDAPYNREDTHFTRIHNLIQLERDIVDEKN